MQHPQPKTPPQPKRAFERFATTSNLISPVWGQDQHLGALVRWCCPVVLKTVRDDQHLYPDAPLPIRPGVVWGGQLIGRYGSPMEHLGYIYIYICSSTTDSRCPLVAPKRGRSGCPCLPPRLGVQVNMIGHHVCWTMHMIGQNILYTTLQVNVCLTRVTWMVWAPSPSVSRAKQRSLT